MRLLTYLHHTESRIAAQIDDYIIDLNRAYKWLLRHEQQVDALVTADLRVPTNMIRLLEGGELSMEAARRAVAFVSAQSTPLPGIRYPIAEIIFLPPVLRPTKVFGLGFNYGSHAAEAGRDISPYPIIFQKTSTSLNGHLQPVVMPRISEQLDYEGELAIIIGRRAKYVSESEAHHYIAGYACSNDINCHDIAYRTSQWTAGLIHDTFCPLGTLVTADEIINADALDLKTKVNGKVVQHGNSADMNFSTRQIVSYISSLTTLEPGDVILTGTPPGIGAFQHPPRFLKAGDTVSVEIEQLGILTNPITTEQLV